MINHSTIQLPDRVKYIVDYLGGEYYGPGWYTTKNGTWCCIIVVPGYFIIHEFWGSDPREDLKKLFELPSYLRSN